LKIYWRVHVQPNIQKRKAEEKEKIFPKSEDEITRIEVGLSQINDKYTFDKVQQKY
jgi:hypothetical protein